VGQKGSKLNGQKRSKITVKKTTLKISNVKINFDQKAALARAGNTITKITVLR